MRTSRIFEMTFGDSCGKPEVSYFQTTLTDEEIERLYRSTVEAVGFDFLIVLRKNTQMTVDQWNAWAEYLDDPCYAQTGDTSYWGNAPKGFTGDWNAYVAEQRLLVFSGDLPSYLAQLMQRAIILAGLETFEESLAEGEINEDAAQRVFKQIPYFPSLNHVFGRKYDDVCGAVVDRCS